MTKYLYRSRLNSFVFSIFQVFSGIERGQIEWDGWNKGTKGNVLIQAQRNGRILFLPSYGMRQTLGSNISILKLICCNKIHYLIVKNVFIY